MSVFNSTNSGKLLDTTEKHKCFPTIPKSIASKTKREVISLKNISFRRGQPKKFVDMIRAPEKFLKLDYYESSAGAKYVSEFVVPKPCLLLGLAPFRNPQI
jgi:hypothetical protein